MRFEKTAEITFKIITKRDLEKLINYFKSIEKEINDENTNLQFEFKFEGGSSIKSENINILNEIDHKKIKSVYLVLDNYYLKKKLNLLITYEFGYLEIESKDKDWVDSKFFQLQEIIEQIPYQNKLLSNTGTAIMLGIIMTILASISLYFLIEPMDFLGKDTKGIVFFIGFFFCLFLIIDLLHKLQQLYPINDFDNTLIHLNKTKKKKKYLLSFLGIIIIPTLLNIIVNLLF